MPLYESCGVTIFQFDHFLQAGLLQHGFSTKLGGVSVGYFATMNLGVNRGDDLKHVAENYHRMAKAIGVLPDSFVFSDQTHEANCYIVTSEDKSQKLEHLPHIQKIDALITNTPGRTLTTFYADCVPLLFFDPQKKVIASAHAGWRGTVLEIGKKAVEQMVLAFGCNPQNILAGIAPSIGACCFEVKADVADQFLQLPYATPFVHKHKEQDGQFFIDLWAVNKQILLHAGLLEEHIEISNLCTKCHPELFYSHRLDGAKRGSMAAFMALPMNKNEGLIV